MHNLQTTSLIRSLQERRGDGETEGPRGLQVDDEVKLVKGGLAALGDSEDNEAESCAQ